MISRLILIAASSRLQIHLDAADIVVARQVAGILIREVSHFRRAITDRRKSAATLARSRLYGDGATSHTAIVR
jgi:hypothetical protein